MYGLSVPYGDPEENLSSIASLAMNAMKGARNCLKGACTNKSEQNWFQAKKYSEKTVYDDFQHNTVIHRAKPQNTVVIFCLSPNGLILN